MNRTPALVSANSGSAAKYTHGCRRCSKRIAGGTTWRDTRLRLLTVWRYFSWASTGVSGSNASRARCTCSPDQSMKLCRFTRDPVGIVNASSTPAIVACTPDISTQNHSTTPTARYGMSA